jgi:hypothetical protein
MSFLFPCNMELKPANRLRRFQGNKYILRIPGFILRIPGFIHRVPVCNFLNISKESNIFLMALIYKILNITYS